MNRGKVYAGLALLFAIVIVAGVALRISGVFTTDAKSEALAASVADRPGGPAAEAGISGIIEFTVRDASGNLKDHGVIHNTVNVEGLNDTFNQITATGLGVFDGIAALDVTVAADDPSDGVLAGSIALLLDGDGVTAGEQNPADGTVTTDFGTESGNGTVAVTFTATGAVTVMQIVLTRSIEDDTLVGGALAIADADIFAYVDVPDIALAASDTVAYTWTVDVD